MARQIIKIDEDKCTGCGVCAATCHERAIEIIGGKAKLTREDFCDGLGNCLPACPTGAITFESREAAACDEEAARQSQMARQQEQRAPCACPGLRAETFLPQGESGAKSHGAAPNVSQLRQWPVQIKLVNVEAQFFSGAELLIAADCTAYACASMHDEFMRGRVTLIGCPKLDGTDYSEKLAQIISLNDIRSVTVAKMEVPCCMGLQLMTEQAIKMSGKRIPHQAITISRNGGIIA